MLKHSTGIVVTQDCTMSSQSCHDARALLSGSGNSKIMLLHSWNNSTYNDPSSPSQFFGCVYYIQQECHPANHTFRLQIIDIRPPGARPNYTDTSAVDKYEMSADAYESLPNSVLAWKKSQKLGRFDPNAPEIEQAKADASFKEVEDRGKEALLPCRRTQLGLSLAKSNEHLKMKAL